MLRKFFHLAAAILMTISSQSYAQERKTPVDEFDSSTTYSLLNCSIQTTLAFAKVDAGTFTVEEAQSSIRKCIDDGKSEAKKLFPKANAQVAKKPAASKLLKEYYAVWITALDGVSPNLTERKIDYNRRQSESSRRVKEAWNRFEIEAGL